MVLVSFSASHRDLDFDTLERLSAGGAEVAGRVLAARHLPTGCVVLATCNRFELYLDTAVGEPGDEPTNAGGADEPAVPAEAVDAVTHVLVAATGLDEARVRDALVVRAGARAAGHLFAVASGLDSMVVGEREIAGQVRRALQTARDAGTTSPVLERTFQRSVAVSRRVEGATRLGGAGRSVVSVGLDLVEASAPRWRQARAVLVGTGSYAGAALAALRARGCDDVRVYSRTGRAEEFARARGVAPIGTEPADLVEALGDADVVVCCSGGVGTVLDAAQVAAARLGAAEGGRVRHLPGAEQRPQPDARPLVVLDLALRRDVHAEVADVDGVLLYDLATVRAHAPAADQDALSHAHRVVAEARDAWREDERTRGADVVRAIREAHDAHRSRTAAALAGLAARTDLTAQDRRRAELEIARTAGAELHAQIELIRR